MDTDYFSNFEYVACHKTVTTMSVSLEMTQPGLLFLTLNSSYSKCVHLMNLKGVTMLKKPVLLALAIAATGSFGATLASPAQDLFDQATFYVGFYYSGPAKVPNFRELRKIYQPQLDQACGTDPKCGYEKAMPIVQKIVSDLKDPFTEIINSDVDRLTTGKGSSTPTVGLQTRAYTGGLLVARANAGEPANLAGVQRGDLIKTINGKPATLEALMGAELDAKPVTLEIDRAGKPQSIAVTPAIVEEVAKPFAVTGAPKNTMVIHVQDFYWGDNVASRVHTLVRKANGDGLKNIVLDLRDSGTGFDSEAMLTAKAFMDSVGLKYQNRFFKGSRTFTFQTNSIVREDEAGNKSPVGQLDKAQLWKGGLVVLVNKYTVHAGEITAQLLQNAKRAQVVGDVTAGQAGVSGGLPSLDVSIGDTALANGAFINVSSDRILALDGTPFPMAVTPDVSVPEDLAAITAGKDPALERAYSILGAK
jgi:carboxyl-terminal processing protease